MGVSDDDHRLSRMFAIRAVDRIGLDTLDRFRALAIASSIDDLTCSRAVVVAGLWSGLSDTSADRAVNRLRGKIAMSSASSGWPLALVSSGRGDGRRLMFVGRVPNFTSTEMGIRWA